MSPLDLLHTLLWPVSYDSVAMRYPDTPSYLMGCCTHGSVNEKTALRRFSEFVTTHFQNDLPIFIDESVYHRNPSIFVITR